jgi:hypothetical protein
VLKTCKLLILQSAQSAKKAQMPNRRYKNGTKNLNALEPSTPKVAHKIAEIFTIFHEYPGTRSGANVRSRGGRGATLIPASFKNRKRSESGKTAMDFDFFLAGNASNELAVVYFPNGNRSLADVTVRAFKDYAILK